MCKQHLRCCWREAIKVYILSNKKLCKENHHFHMLFEWCHTGNRKRSIKQHTTHSKPRDPPLSLCSKRIRSLWPLPLSLSLSPSTQLPLSFTQMHVPSDRQYDLERTIGNNNKRSTVAPACKVSVLSNENWLISIRVPWLGPDKNWPYMRVDLTSVDHITGLDCTSLTNPTTPGSVKLMVQS